jgi:hypothetical protein
MLVLVSGLPHGDKHVLKQFLAAVVIAAHTPDKRQQRIGVPPQQNGERLALPSGDALHQAFIGFVGQFQLQAPLALPYSLRPAANVLNGFWENLSRKWSDYVEDVALPSICSTTSGGWTVPVTMLTATENGPLAQLQTMIKGPRAVRGACRS